MANYETVVGLEIHAHLKTESKMFCSCGTGPKGKDYKASEKDDPNVRICPLCTGQPGTLPVPNEKAIEDTILLGLALGSEINPKFNFERKNYYYPDLPKAYQITSATNPPVIGGGLEIEVDGDEKFIQLDHVHLEEDAGKLTHDKSGDFSLVDLNRAGTPLLEIITQPVLSNGREATTFMKNLQSILRYLDISDADMEKGQMRCDANISVRKVGTKELGVKVEIKNMNSFKMIEKAIAYETKRQIEVLEDGGKLEQETRGWDDNKGKTTPQRSKEFANDYRYFPEPDIPPIETGKGKAFDPKTIADRLPELPKEKKNRFVADYGVSEHDAHLLSLNFDLARYYEQAIEAIPAEAKGSEERKKAGKAVANLLITEILGKISAEESIDEIKITPENLAELVILIGAGEISGKIAKELIPEMLATGTGAKSLVFEKGLVQISDEGELNKIIVQVLAENANQVMEYKSGKEALYGFFVGQVMKITKGQANPAKVNEILKKELSK
jgi:aspartyl-tRNA(Asn)/glutamyl-tRNA(Gln) amidotransferase subunit B